MARESFASVRVRNVMAIAGREARVSVQRWLADMRPEQRSVVIAYALIVLLIGLGSLITPRFASPNFLLLQLLKASFLGLVAAGQMAVILTGNIDLSVSWTLNLAAVIVTSVAQGQDERLWMGVLAGLSVGLIVGLLNGLGVAYLRIPSLVLTLGMNAVVKGVTVLYTSAQPKGEAPQALNFVVHHKLAGALPMAVLVWAAASVVSIIILHYSALGRKIYAVGNNEVAAYLSGVKTPWVLVSAFAVSGVMNAMAGILLVGYAGRSFNAMGEPYLLPAIAAVVIGGTNILGGSGLYAGTVAGVIIITLLESALSIMQIPQAGRNIIYGVVILGMLFLYGRGQKVTE